MSTPEDVRVAAAIPDDAAGNARVNEEFGQRLSSNIQAFLSTNRCDWDKDLFFDDFGRPPRDGSSWPQAILDVLHSREDISDADRESIISRSAQEAIANLSS